MLSRGEGEARGEGGGGRGGAEQQSVKADKASPPPSNLRCVFLLRPPSLAHSDEGGTRGRGGVSVWGWGSLVKPDRPP